MQLHFSQIVTYTFIEVFTVSIAVRSEWNAADAPIDNRPTLFDWRI